MEQKETLGKRIAALRKEKGLTQEQLAEKVGVSAQAVSKWENDISCPDITLLPLLGDLFGVSVDELLGVKPIEPHVVIINDEPAEKKENKGFQFEWNKNTRFKSWHTVAFCVGAILICLFYILHNMTGLFPYIEQQGLTLKDWNYIWPLLVFTLGLMSVPSNIPVGVTLSLYGAYEFIRRVLIPYGINLVAIPWSVVFMVLAILVLLMVILGRLHLLPRFRGKKGSDRSPVMEYSSENDYLKAEMSFGNSTIRYDRPTLQGGEIDSNFGDYTIDLRDVVTFAPNCLLKIDQSFGNITVLLPGTVRLVKKSDTSFAAFSQVGNADDNAPYTMVLCADVNFGSLQVKYE